MNETRNIDAMKQSFARHFSPALLARMEETGHAHLETAAEGSWVTGSDGVRRLDCYCAAGIHNLGRRPEALAAALKEAVRHTDQGNFPMLSEEKVRLAAALGAFIGRGLECAVYGVVRGETIEFACKLARGCTQRSQLFGIEGGYYGETGFALSLSRRAGSSDFGALIPEVDTLPAEDHESLSSQITTATAGVIVEPVQVENHCRELSSDYLNALAARCKKIGALLVVDESQTAFGRTGARFAFEHSGIEPDALALGESLGGGMFPITVTMLTQQANAFMNAHPMIHLSTFGGHDVGCRVALEALELYERLAPWDNAARQGERLRGKAESLAGAWPQAIRSVAGRGLAVSLRVASPEQARRLCRLLSENGVLARPGRIARDTVLLRPSLLISDSEMEHLESALAASVEKLQQK